MKLLIDRADELNLNAVKGNVWHNEDIQTWLHIAFEHNHMKTQMAIVRCRTPN